MIERRKTIKEGLDSVNKSLEEIGERISFGHIPVRPKFTPPSERKTQEKIQHKKYIAFYQDKNERYMIFDSISKKTIGFTDCNRFVFYEVIGSSISIPLEDFEDILTICKMCNESLYGGLK